MECVQTLVMRSLMKNQCYNVSMHRAFMPPNWVIGAVYKAANNHNVDIKFL